MKKLLLIAAALTTTTASAANTASVNVTVNGTVMAACEFDSTVTGASFDYSALSGSSNAAAGSATLYCNSGATPAFTNLTNQSLSLTSGTNTMNATYNLTRSNVTTASGSHNGADQTTYTLDVSAAAGQWNLPTGTYTGQVSINVVF